jgi:hypothetical protein
VGQEAQCTVRFGKEVSAGKARLESEDLKFSGTFRLHIPFKAIESLDARDGRLRVKFAEGVATFELGDAAAKWAEKIRNPKGLIDKLGVKPEHKVAVLGVSDHEFWRQLRARAADLSQEAVPKDTDILFLAANRKEELKKLAPLRERIKRNGAIWVVRPKGKLGITEADVMAAGKAAGLVDTKVVSFSATHTAEKFVIPLARR